MARATRISRSAIAALVVVALLAIPAGAAEGAKEKTKITLKKISSSGASGKVISKRSGCEPHRKVTLFKYVDFVTEKVKITQSDSHGRWRVRQNLAARQVLRQGRRGQAVGHPLPLRHLQERARLTPSEPARRLSVSPIH